MKLRDYLAYVVSAPSLEELWAIHCKQMEEYGFEKLFYGCTRYRTPTSLGDPDDFVILTNHDPEYINGFLHSGRYYHAPMFRWALDNEGAASWRMIPEMINASGLPELKRVHEYNQKMGIKVGYTISFQAMALRSKGGVSLCARKDLTQDDVDAIWAEHGDEIHLMNQVAHLKVMTLPYSPPKRHLTKRQREALQWVGDGKTTQDIALLMGLTAATVEKHLRLARETLSVETTAQAVMKAALLNQMYVVDA
ncbi:LuxR family transcriptional regulator [Chachezhania antarctica]|uniref:LuxR family transcriptional regulator n=1 Tax=Chachezhania antarctica TaxID=2340860 RepID=UPI000EB1496D|nr:LuxR family transcriptional regulator [Chachezhania antarctica]|tara:strand:- start:2105 stop:2857 length:753 start_codon:yes stop_codon:yes gene_type:complete